jgi:AbrB family looped-hinge helix DNA binding protein
MSSMQTVQRVLGGRRVSIPEAASKALGIKEGDYVIMEVEADGLRIIPAEVSPRSRRR